MCLFVGARGGCTAPIIENEYVGGLASNVNVVAVQINECMGSPADMALI